MSQLRTPPIIVVQSGMVVTLPCTSIFHRPSIVILKPTDELHLIGFRRELADRLKADDQTVKG